MNLFVLPFGTALAIYTFWVLLHNEARALFVAVDTLVTHRSCTPRRRRPGFDANVAAALSYLVGFVTGIIFLLVEKENSFVRFHAMQSTLVFAGIVAIDVLLQIVPDSRRPRRDLRRSRLSAILWLLLMFKAYQGEEFKLPWSARSPRNADLMANADMREPEMVN